jgi:hypothetical protein
LSADKSTKQTFIKLVVLVGDVKDEDLGGQTGHWNLDIRSIPLSDNLNYSIVSFVMFYMRASFVEKELRHLLDLVYEPSSSCLYSYLRRYVPIAINQYSLSITFLNFILLPTYLPAAQRILATLLHPTYIMTSLQNLQTVDKDTIHSTFNSEYRG